MTSICVRYNIATMSGKRIIISDIDGTVAVHDQRIHLINGIDKDFDSFHADHINDKPNQDVIDQIKKLGETHAVVFMTGRYSVHRASTLKQLKDWGLDVNELFMRDKGDHTPNHEIKLRWLKSVQRENSNVTIDMMFDDNIKVIESFTRKGIKCVHVE